MNRIFGEIHQNGHVGPATAGDFLPSRQKRYTPVLYYIQRGKGAFTPA